MRKDGAGPELDEVARHLPRSAGSRSPGIPSPSSRLSEIAPQRIVGIVRTQHDLRANNALVAMRPPPYKEQRALLKNNNGRISL